MAKVAPTIEEVSAFLSDVHGAAVSDVQALEGGFWSTAFAYRLGERELVVRLGDVPEGFEMDRAAMAFRSADLPIPDVLDIGEGLGRSYAISVRHHGRFLESVQPDEADRAGPALLRLLAALRAVPAPPGASPAWYDPKGHARDSTWRGWLTAGLADDPHHVVSGWRATMAADPELDRFFETCLVRINGLLDACPERRDLVHGDLLHANVLLAQDASRVTGLFSWKCAVRGDFLFDVALCTFWSTWYPGIAALNLWERVLSSPLSSDDLLIDAALRHHCYELQIGASHLGWNVWRGDRETLDLVVARTREVLERGPLEAARA